MNRIARFLLVSVFGTLSIGCGEDRPAANGRRAGDGSRRQSQAPRTEGNAMQYTSAEVKIVDGPLAKRTMLIEDQTEIRQLLSFFPGAGRGRKAPEPPGPWINAVVIEFTRADGTVLSVSTSCAVGDKVDSEADREANHIIYFWSEGQGDWLLADSNKFQTYFRKLFAEEMKSEKQGEE